MVEEEFTYLIFHDVGSAEGVEGGKEGRKEGREEGKEGKGRGKREEGWERRGARIVSLKVANRSLADRLLARDAVECTLI